MGGVLLLSSYIIFYSVSISDILEHIFWYCSIFPATNNSTWLTWASFVVLDILYLLVYDSLVRFALRSSSCLEHKSFLLYIPYYCLSMLIHLLSLVLPILLASLYYSFKFLPKMWFLSLVSFTSWFFLNIAITTFVLTFLVHSLSLSILMSLLSSLMSTWSFLKRISIFIFVFPKMCCRMKS